MLPNGILGIIANDPSVVARFHEIHRRRCAVDQSVSCQQLESGLVSLGSVTSTVSEVAIHASRSTDGSTLGVFNGVAFDDWNIEYRPHELLSLSTKEIDAGANGMFQACAADDRQLALLTDPWGTLPVYVFHDADTFAFSCSLRALAEACISDAYIANTEGISQLLSFGQTIDGQTIYPGIRRLGRATVCRVRKKGQRVTFTEEEYFSPKVEPSEYRGIDDDIVDSFRSAVRKLHRKSEGDMVCTLSGGMDSRVIASAVAAEGFDLPFATHAVREGHDLRIAIEVAKRLHLRHHVVTLPEELPLDHRAKQFMQGSNGLLPFDNYHVMWAFPQYASLGRFVLDGVHTSIEGRWFLRNNSRQAVDKQSFYQRTREAMLRPGILRYARGAAVHVQLACEILERLIPDPAGFASPGCCADVFNVRTLLPTHGADGAMLQNHFLRYISPYLDRDYVSVISRVAEQKRWVQHPQRLIVRKLAPQLANLHRSYSDILSWPTDNPYLLRVPVGLERLYGKLKLDRLPSLHRKLSRRAPTIGSTLIADGTLQWDGLLARFFDLSAELLPPCGDGQTYVVREELHALLHFLISEQDQGRAC
ncbi:MAG: asparagine synthase-related protein [Bacteroidota bacterium]